MPTVVATPELWIWSCFQPSRTRIHADCYSKRSKQKQKEHHSHQYPADAWFEENSHFYIIQLHMAIRDGAPQSLGKERKNPPGFVSWVRMLLLQLQNNPLLLRPHGVYHKPMCLIRDKRGSHFLLPAEFRYVY